MWLISALCGQISLHDLKVFLQGCRLASKSQRALNVGLIKVLSFRFGVGVAMRFTGAR